MGGVVYNIFSSNTTVGVETEPHNFSYSAPPVRSSIVLSFKVVCAENYYGPDCDCSRLCTKNCTCDPGFTGEFCHGVYCGENRQCIDGVNNYTCVCNPGYTGANCDVNIDDCQAMIINCSGRGECLDGINSFICMCDAGYTGKYCEVVTTDSEIETETQAPEKNNNLKAILGGAIGALVFLVLLLLLTVGALTFKLSTRDSKQKRKGEQIQLINWS